MVKGRLMAGAYPGDQDPEMHRAKVQGLVDEGIRVFVSLMEEGETNREGRDFAPYEGEAVQRAPNGKVKRHAVRDVWRCRRRRG